MRRRLRKSWRKLKAGDPVRALRALATPHHTETRIETARATVAAALSAAHGNTVAHGPFAGLRLPERPAWGRHDVSAKILGSYERPVVDALIAAGTGGGLFVDLGAADGYFATGLLHAGAFDRALCFEASARGRDSLRAAAARNGLSERVEIRGLAEAGALMSALPEGQEGALLADIEGGEFALFTAALLTHLSAMTVVIELHETQVANGPALRAALIARAAGLFDVEILGPADPTPSAFPELAGFDDDHRLLAFSEGRDRAMAWLLLRPKA